MPRTITLYSRNNHFQHAEVLRRNRQKRQHFREFFVEGVRSINQALHHGWSISSFLYTRERPLSDWAEGILASSTAETHLELPLDLLQELSAKTDTSELIALVRMPEDRLSRIPIRSDLLAVVFDRPASPGNLGTLIRSCDALGAAGLVLAGHGVDLYDPETISASTGSVFALPTVRIPGPTELAAWIDELRARLGSVQVIGSDERAERPVWEYDFCGPTVLLLGNEKWGLAAAYRELCDTLTGVPIGGSASSLNVASAASIILYEIARQRQSTR